MSENDQQQDRITQCPFCMQDMHDRERFKRHVQKCREPYRWYLDPFFWAFVLWIVVSLAGGIAVLLGVWP